MVSSKSKDLIMEDVKELKLIMLALQKELQDFRRENKELHDDLRMLKKVFAYKEKKVTSKERREAIVNKFKASVLLG